MPPLLLPRFLRRWCEDVFALDPRALALFRIAAGLVLLYDLADRARFLTAHYTDQGVLPAARVLEEFGRGVVLSVHYQASGSPRAVAALFALAAVAALALVLGFRTRVATVLSWYLLVSLQARNHYVALLGGDYLLRMVLLWGIFLPLGERWSLDAARRAQPARGSVLSLASAALVLQIFVMYFATGVLKSGELWARGWALHYALNLHQYETPLTPLLLGQPWLLRVLTRYTLWLERLGPFLLLLPVVQPAARLLALALFGSLHVGMAMFLNIGPFPIMALCPWPAVLPGRLLDALGSRLRVVARPRADSLAPQGGAAEPPPPRRGPFAGRLAQAVVGAALAYTIVSQALILAGAGVPRPLHAFGTLFRINQSWAMFAPDPSPTAMWLGVDGHLAGGGHYDPFRATAAVWERPANIPASSRGFRWRLYTWTALLKGPRYPRFAEHQGDFAAFLCREWNASHSGDEALVSLDTLAFLAVTHDAASEYRPPMVIHTHTCADARGPRGRVEALAPGGPEG